MIYSQDLIVGASLCGTDAKLSAVGAMALIENSLTELTGKLHIDGLTVMHKYGAVLVFTRNHIDFPGSADWNETITVESFLSGKSSARFAVDTCVKNAAGDVVVYSRIELCGVDLETGKIRRVETIGLDDSIETEPPLREIGFCRRLEKETSFAENVTVRTSNLDYAHHTNNIEYVRWLINFFSAEELEQRPIRAMEMHYVSQSFEGDELSIYACKEPEESAFEIRKQDQSVMKCHMWR